MALKASLLALLGAGCATGSYGPTAMGRGSCAWRVCVTTEDGPAGRAYRVTNDEPVPVTVRLDFRTVDNLVRPPEGRIEREVAPRSREVIRVERIRSGPVGAELILAIDLGASSTVPDDHVYAVPFGGRTRRSVVQGFDGDGSHLGSMRYAVDIEMPIDTPVLAARDGVVLYLQDGFLEGRAEPEFLERANLVVVAHADGTMASYGHLARGLEVRVGDTVAVGDLLGWSGRSGFAARPHLHFQVGVRLLGEPGRTIPFRMEDAQGRPVDVAEGSSIEPAPGGPARRDPGR